MTDPLIQGARPEAARRYGILVVDDEEAIVESLELTLEDDYRVFTALSGEDGLEILDREDDRPRDRRPGDARHERRRVPREGGRAQPRTMRMMLTGYADMSSLVRAINDGRIYRYIQKPWEPDELRIDVKRALEAHALVAENAQLAAALADANEQPARREPLPAARGRAALRVRPDRGVEPGDAAGVRRDGEGGADRRHRAAHRRDRAPARIWSRAPSTTPGRGASGRFVAQNCGALPDTLLESELFGHKKGAFTGAHADKKGLFEVADGGTIFLDEIGETEPGMQVRLLRVLQDGEIRPLGSSATRTVDVRIIAATNRDLASAVAEGRFREDLYYRLRVVEIELPPLRERREDIPALAHHFLDRANEKMGRQLRGFTNAAMDRLVRHDWSGNVRELENEIERAVALAGDAETISLEMLSEHLRGAPAPETAGAIATAADGEIRDLNDAVDDLKRPHDPPSRYARPAARPAPPSASASRASPSRK